MDNEKTGGLIRRLRRERGLTQQQLAEQLGVSDKAVSKWERGLGGPELGLLPELAEALEVDMGRLISGELAANERVSGNVNRARFWVCPCCGNVVTALADTGVSCCGKKLRPLAARKAGEEHSLTARQVETEFFISSGHPMERAPHRLSGPGEGRQPAAAEAVPGVGGADPAAILGSQPAVFLLHETRPVLAARIAWGAFYPLKEQCFHSKTVGAVIGRPPVLPGTILRMWDARPYRSVGVKEATAKA